MLRHVQGLVLGLVPLVEVIGVRKHFQLFLVKLVALALLLLHVVLVNLLLSLLQVVRVNISSLFLGEGTELVVVNTSVLVLVQVAEDEVDVLGCELDFELFEGVYEVRLTDFSFL